MSFKPSANSNLAEGFFRPWVLALLTVLGGVLAYANSIHGVFLLDDASSIAGNPTIRHLVALGDIFSTRAHVTVQSRPILNLSLALNYAISGTEVWSYHCVNIFVHILSGLFLFGIALRVLKRIASEFLLTDNEVLWLSFLIALLWTVHPLQTEAVTYVIQRAESLMGFFFLGTFYCFLRAVEKETDSALWLSLSVVFSFLGMATKEVMVSAPLLVLFLDRSFISGNLKQALTKRTHYYLGLVLSWGVLVLLVIRSGGNRGGTIGFGTGVPWMQYGKTQCEAIIRYLKLSLWPNPLVFEYGTFTSNELSQWLPWALVLVPLLIASVWAYIYKPKLGFLGAWFFCILSPTSLVPGTSQMIVEHRMYLPLAAVMALLVWICYLLWKKYLKQHMVFQFLVIFLMLISISFGALTYMRNAVYQSPLGMWQDTVAKKPLNALAHTMLAEEYVAQANDSEALKEYMLAININPSLYLAQEEVALLYLRHNQDTQALVHIQEALRLFPTYPDALNSYGVVCVKRNDAEVGINYFNQAVAQKPDYAEAYYNRGNAYASLDKHDLAIDSYKQALRVKSDLPSAYYNMGNSLVALSRRQEAVQAYESAISLKPNYPTAEYNIGNLLVELDKKQEAIQHFQRAILLKPNFLDAVNNLGILYFNLGRLKESEQMLLQALKQNPSEVSIQANLIEVRSALKKQNP